jgi:hypothetical protein
MNIESFDDKIYDNYSVYRKIVDALTECLFIELSGNETKDHILPVSFGYNWKLPPHLIADKRNVRVVSRSENSKKNYKCTHIPKFIQKYMIDKHHRTMYERKMSGIARAKEEGLYTGRKKGSSESIDDFLNKPKIKLIVEYLNKDWKHVDIADEIGVHINTITKVKKILKSRN